MAFTTDNFSFKVNKKIAPSPEAVQSILVDLHHFIYKDEESGFYVAQVKIPPDHPNLNINVAGRAFLGRTFKIVGTSSFVVENIKEKQEINIFGNFELSKGDIQFKTQSVKEIIPTKPKAIQLFLASGKIKGIGPVTAKKIVDKFGAETISILDNEHRKLLTVEGITEKKLVTIHNSWQYFRNIYEIISTMQIYGVGDSNGVKIYNHFKEKTLEVIKTDPYKLTEVPMIGFRTADKIAQSIGISHIDPQRVRYCIFYTLEKLAEEGHTAYIQEELVKKVNDELNIDPSLIVSELDDLIKKQDVVYKQIKTSKTENNKIVTDYFNCVAHRKFHNIEVRMAKELFRITHAETPPMNADIFLHSNPYKLDESQLNAARTILTSKLSILTGGPGTGKTHTIKSILNFFTSQEKKCLLCAPTGRAAKRMEEATGHDSSTMHRTLGFAEGRFTHDESNQLNADVIIVDEFSMVDSFLGHGFLKAVKDSTIVIFVGDVDQLPSVGPGNVLRDLIDSKCIAVARLNIIHRQALNSNIIKASHQVIRNKMPEFIEAGTDAESDFEFLEMESNDEIYHGVMNLVDTLVSTNQYKKDDIQILSPRKDNACGVDEFNYNLKMLLNYDEEFELHRDRKIKFSPGDRVMQYKNNYDLDIFNGDVGKIVDFSYEDLHAVVEFDNKYINIEGADLNDLKLSYAITIHKSQGSDYPCVIIPISKSHTIMWNCNLLYTAITRGKNKVYLVGDKKTLFYAVAKFRQNSRITGLKEELERTFMIYSPDTPKVKLN